MDIISILGIVFLALILLTIPAMAVVSMRRLRARRHQFQRYAHAHGFSYAANQRLPAELRVDPYFRGSVQLNFGRRIKNVLRRHQKGVETLVFDYWYVGHTSIALPTSQTTRATVVCLREGKSGTWRVFHQDGFQYLDFAMLEWFLGESMKQFSPRKT